MISAVEKEEEITIEQYNQELDNAVAEIENGEYFTHEEMIAYSKIKMMPEMRL